MWSTPREYLFLLHDVRDIECKYGFLECKYRKILHRSTTDCTAVSARGQTTVKGGRINGGKLRINSGKFSTAVYFYSSLYFVLRTQQNTSDSLKYPAVLTCLITYMYFIENNFFVKKYATSE